MDYQVTSSGNFAVARVLALSKKVWDATSEDKRANLPSWISHIQSGDLKVA